ncbi:hypothetical protein HHL19_29685 [Streptomyces sp. R302]|uniref:hypothetical protein n=1 Tax=unclassified Streptomyces TaxID=2593676 RepID=UPI00145F1955|nr:MULTISPECIES: hypothetical protein [unclassified Streptomyces]NML55296.1 hypothetical protein [Streptomyces sp. R301]NML82716.1 hypothetical protein [Streptomyces sp. R302]
MATNTTENTGFPETNRRRIARGHRGWGLLCVLLGLLALGGAVGLGAMLPERIDAERAYLDAVPCAAGERATAADADCLRTVRGTVESVEKVTSGKARFLRVSLRPPVAAPLDRPLELSTRGELSEVLGPGDEVTVTLWRDLRVSAHHAGRSEDVDARPDSEVGPLVGLAAACAWLAAVAFTGAYGGERRARGIASGRPVQAKVGFGFAKLGGILGVPFLLGIVVGKIWDGWTTVLVTAGVTALIAVQATVFALRVDRPQTRRRGRVT